MNGRLLVVAEQVLAFKIIGAFPACFGMRNDRPGTASEWPKSENKRSYDLPMGR